MNTDDALNAIDAALESFTTYDPQVGPDAMRSSPEQPIGTIARRTGVEDWDGWEVIHVYTRAQAIEAWNDCVAWPPEDGAPQDEAGRLWDVLWMTRLTFHSGHGHVEMVRVPRGGEEIEEVALKAVLGPGDDGEPVITIMLPDED